MTDRQHQETHATDEICTFGVRELGRLYRRRDLSPVQVVNATLARIESLNPCLNAFISVTSDTALAEARTAEALFMSGTDLGPLQGIPYSVKDVIRARGTRTTAASKALQDAPIDRTDADAVHRFRTCGAILVGKTNLHEFAGGAPDPDSPFGIVHNPRRLGSQTGISSSGSGAAVAAGLGVISLGTDTGGSVRYPASLCGVVGLKPTYGLVSLDGVIPLSHQLDHVGPLARSVADVTAAFDALSAPGAEAGRSAQRRKSDLAVDISRLRIGIDHGFCDWIGLPDPLISGSMVDRIRAFGASVSDIGLPRSREAYECWQVIVDVDLAVYHTSLRTNKNLYGKHFQERIRTGQRFTATQYAAARVVKEDCLRLWMSAFDQVDLIMLPANHIGAPPLGVDTMEIKGLNLSAKLLCSPANRISNMTGLPAIVVPIGEDSTGMPLAVQLVAPPFGERKLLAAAEALEDSAGNLVQRWGIAVHPE